MPRRKENEAEAVVNYSEGYQMFRVQLRWSNLQDHAATASFISSIEF
jgi:hypothetical protein